MNFAENLPSAYDPDPSNALHKEMQIGNDLALASMDESNKASRVSIANDFMLFKNNTMHLVLIFLF